MEKINLRKFNKMWCDALTKAVEKEYKVRKADGKKSSKPIPIRSKDK